MIGFAMMTNRDCSRTEKRTPSETRPGRLKRLLFFPVFLLLLVLPDPAVSQRRSHEVFFEGTDYELHVFRIYGKLPGKTLLLIGGIQGDEPGGFLSADHYADISLRKGNLIVVPRANFHSIVLNRRKVNEDMNRKFADESQHNYEDKIVAILKRLIQESDCLLNLHDGSGFFSETWVSSERNPLRYGQSIIADAETYRNPKTREVVDLGNMARAVAQHINRDIDDSHLFFHFNNHRTEDAGTPHKEQRKSATFYALYTCGIPAFGIETSKQLPLETKVRHHNLAINAFMERLGVVPETPGVNLDPPELNYLVVAVNDALPVAVRNRQTLFVKPGDTVTIVHIEANYERGLSADLLNYGTLSDMRKPFQIHTNTRIVVRKDYHPFGEIYLALDRVAPPMVAKAVAVPEKALPALREFRTRINGKERVYRNYEQAKLKKGDLFEIVDVLPDRGDPAQWVVNFKGFVGDRMHNTGEDRGYVINTGTDLMQRYSLSKKGLLYQVVVTHEDKELGKLFVELEEPGVGTNGTAK